MSNACRGNISKPTRKRGLLVEQLARSMTVRREQVNRVRSWAGMGKISCLPVVLLLVIFLVGGELGNHKIKVGRHTSVGVANRV